MTTKQPNGYLPEIDAQHSAEFQDYLQKHKDDLLDKLINATAPHNRNEQEARELAGCHKCIHPCTNHHFIKASFKIAACALFLRYAKPNILAVYPYYIAWQEYRKMVAKSPSMASSKENPLIYMPDYPKNPRHTNVLPRAKDAFFYRERWWTKSDFDCLILSSV